MDIITTIKPFNINENFYYHRNVSPYYSIHFTIENLGYNRNHYS
jgi:hypothetical protein